MNRLIETIFQHARPTDASHWYQGKIMKRLFVCILIVVTFCCIMIVALAPSSPSLLRYIITFSVVDCDDNPVPDAMCSIRYLKISHTHSLFHHPQLELVNGNYISSTNYDVNGRPIVTTYSRPCPTDEQGKMSFQISVTYFSPYVILLIDKEEYCSNSHFINVRDFRATHNKSRIAYPNGEFVIPTYDLGKIILIRQ